MINLALKKKIVVNEAHYQNYIVENAVDGDLSSGYLTANNNVVADLIIDLGNLYRIENFELTNFIYSSIYRTKEFEIYASKDDIYYKPLLTGILPENLNQHTFENTDKNSYFRYVKLSLKSHYGSTNSVGIGEIKVYGCVGGFLLKSNNKIYSIQSKETIHETKMTSNNKPAPLVASASSVYSSSHPAWKAFDGDIYTSNNGWVTESNVKTGWIQIDFGENKKVNAFKVLARNGSDVKQLPKDFVLYGSDDGVYFNKIKKISNVSNWKEGEFKTFYLYGTYNNRYYKIEILDNNGGSYTAIGEIQYLYYENLIQLPSYSLNNLINYSTLHTDFHIINNNKNYILQDTVSENTDDLWVQEIDRKPLSIKFE